jgi:hypothetical protein
VSVAVFCRGEWAQECCGHTGRASSQSARGDRFAANLKSVVHTCRTQQCHVLNYLVNAIQAAFKKRSTPSLLCRAP